MSFGSYRVNTVRY